MSSFIFQIIGPEQRLIGEERMCLPDLPSVWSELIRMSWRVTESGTRMEVRDESGDVVIRVGIATARATADRVHVAA